ncbi:MAG: alpha-amylase family glycosyl hydrolase [Candidatus Dormibacteria bacterium]
MIHLAGADLCAGFDEAGNLTQLGRPGEVPDWEFGAGGRRDETLYAALEPIRGSEQVLRVTRRSPRWQVDEQWSIISRQSVLERRLVVSNAGAEGADLRGLTAELPPLVVTPGLVAVLPGSLPPGDRELDGGDGVVRALQNGVPYRDPLAFIWDLGRRLGLGAWFYSESDLATVEVITGPAGPRVRHLIEVLARLRPGQHLDLGRQFLWVGRGHRQAVLRSVRRAHAAAGVRPPRRRLPGLRSKVLYCGHPGGGPEQYFRGGGGFDELVARVPALQDMGIDLFWSLPIFEHGDGSRDNLYGPSDHRRISGLYGGQAGLRRFADSLRAAGIGLLLDVVPHGPPDDSPLARDHPGWTSLDEGGRPIYSWGQLAFDNANPAWQRWMAGAIGAWAARLSLAGLRIDVAQGGPPNWDPAVPYHASYAGLGGGLGMTRALRGAVVGATGAAVVIPEEWTGAVPFMVCSDLTYDFQLFFLLLELEAAGSTSPRWASTLQSFFADQQAATPRGALRMRFLCHHDTILHFGLGRPRDIWGDARARALQTLMFLIDGVPLVFAGEEDRAIFTGREADQDMVNWAVELSAMPVVYAPATWPRKPQTEAEVRRRVAAPGVPLAPLIKELTTLRRRVPALAGSTADYSSARADHGVFACLRGHGRGRVLVLVNLGAKDVESRVHLTPGLRRRSWTDLVSGASIGPGARALTVAVPAAGYRLLQPSPA